MITIKDIAERAGVSYATVSRALNGRSDVSPQTRIHVLELAKELGYQPNAIARSLVNRKSEMIALIVPDVSNPFFADITMTVNKAAEEAGYTVVVCNTGWDSAKEQEKLRIMVEQRVDGIILKPVSEINPDRLRDLNVPLVLFWHAQPDQMSYVEVDHEAGAKLAVRHLVGRGYRKIAYLGGKLSSPANTIRMDAYKKTLTDAGIEVREDLINNGGFSLESGYQRIASMFRLANPPDAVFCGNDIIALGVLQYVRDHGINVPRDFGIIGFDDISYASLPQVRLSTISQPRDKLGRQAFDALLAEMEAWPNRTGQKILVEPELVVRGTT
jgi:LacI family transcriptional regulator